MALSEASVAVRSQRMWLALGAGLVLMLLVGPAEAALNNMALLDTVVAKFSEKAIGWKNVMMNAATWLFWTLGTISLVWTGGMMALRKADMGEFFAEFIRFILFFGFFLWLLRNGPAFAASILESMQRLGANAAGQASVTPSAIVDIGFLIWQQAVANISAMQPVQSLVGILLSGSILLLLAAVAVNMLLLLVSGWILMYAGIFFLGFGGSRWTSDMAINYYKSVLGVGVQLMSMILLVGIGNDLLAGYYRDFDQAASNLNEMIIMLVFCLVLLVLATKVPAMVAGMVTGGAGASGALGSFGAGAVMGAAMGAAGAASAAAGMAGAAMRSGAANAAGGAQALMAAYSKASGSSGDDAGPMPDIGGGEDNASAFADMDSGKAAEGGGGDGDGSARSESSVGGQSSSAGTGAAIESPSSGGGGGSSEPGTANESAEAAAAGEPQPGAGQDNQGNTAALSSPPKSASGFGRVLATAAGTASYLAQGSLAVGKEKMSSLRTQARQRVDATVGAKIAMAIQHANASSVDGRAGGRAGDRAGGRAERATEVAAFVQRDSSRG